MPLPHNPGHPRTRDRGGKRALQIYLTPDEHTRTHHAARSSGMSASDYVADILANHRPPNFSIRSVIRWLHAKYGMQQFVNGDCVASMKTLADQSVHLVVTSPPYNIGKQYNTAGDKLSVEEYLAFSQAWMTEAARVLHEDGSLWINVASMKDPSGGMIPIDYLLWPIGKEVGLNFVQPIVWHHHTGKPQKTRFTQITERWMFWTKKPRGYTWNLDAVRVPPKTKDRRNNPNGANPTDLWNFPSLVHGAKARPDHPCPFPQPMIERIIKVSSNPGNVVLDPFGGSGTTALAAQKLGRDTISIEIDPGFHALSMERFEANTAPPQELMETGETKEVA